MPNTLVKDWFGDAFYDLHPLLQKLHIRGGELTGDIELSYGTGIAGWIGARIARKTGLPVAGVHRLSVSISHDSNGLHWNRRFNDSVLLKSLFRPTGNIERGYWIETTGALSFRLTVNIREGGWHWRCLGISVHGVPMPRWLFPDTRAYKIIENEKYRFYVGFSWPIIGSLVSYQGLLQASGRDNGSNDKC